MSLKDLLGTSSSSFGGIKEDTEVTREIILKNLNKYQQLISYWRMYPDRFIDYMCSLDPDCNFQFIFYQRLFLRMALRSKNMYATFVRA